MKKLILTLLLFCNSIFSEIPIQDFIKFSEFTNLIISPDGKYFASEVDAERTEGLVIIERSTMKVIYTHHFGKDKYIAEFDWLNNERLGIRIGTKVGTLEAPRQTIFYWAVNADGTKKKLLLGSLAPQRLSRGSRENIRIGWNEIVDILPNDKDHILASIAEKALPTVYKININTGRLKKVLTMPAGSGILDQENNIRVSFGATRDNKEVFWYRPSKDDEWEQHGIYSYGKGGIVPLAFSEDDSYLLVKCSTKKEPVWGLCSYEPESRSLKTIYRHERVDSDEYIYDGDSELPVGVILMDGKEKIHWLDKKSKTSKKIRALQKTFKGYVVDLESVTKDQSEAVIWVHNDKDPGGYYLFNMNTNELKDLNLSVRSWTKVDQLVNNEPFSYTSRDGLEIHGYIHKPKGQSKNLPLVLYVHGGPHGPRDNWGYDRTAQFLANRGYAVMQVNYRGSGGYGDDFLNKGFKRWGDAMQDDLTDAVNWAVDQEIVDKDRMCIYGASYGGYAAMMSASREPDLYRCAIGYVGVYDVDSFTSTGNIPSWRGGRAYLKTVIPDDPEKRKAFSPTHQADKIKAAIFLIHGKDDKQAHFENYELMAKKLKSIGKPFKSMVKDNEEHGFYNRENVHELYTELDSFLSEHIGK